VEALGRVVAPIAKWWKQASAGQRAAIGLFLALSVALLGGVAVLASRPSYGVLFSNLQSEDGGAIVAALKDLKMPYRVGADGSSIEVPTDKVRELRLQLAGQGLPRGGNVGFEIFDKSQMGLSEFTEKLNYQRALQGELARTIAELQPVEFARVHIVLPQERLYTTEQEPVTASVVLALKPAAQLSSQQIGSIVHLVSSSVEGLKPGNVTVVDTAGELLSSQVEAEATPGSPSLAASQLRSQRDFETEMARSLQSMLEKVLGPGRAVVRVSAKMNFDNQQTEEETFQPANGAANGAESAKGVLAQQEQVEESYSGGKGAAPSGIPGVASNTGTAPKIASKPGGSDSYQHSETKTEYRVSRRVNRVTVQPGQVQRLSVAVFVDGDLGRTQIARIQESVTAAAGLDPSRGDQVIVQGAKFSAAPDQETRQERQLASRRTLITVGKDAAAVVLLLIFLIFARSAFKTKEVPDLQPTPPPVMPDGRPVTAYRGIAAAGAPAEENVTPLTQLTQVESEDLARSIRAWLTEPQLERES